MLGAQYKGVDVSRFQKMFKTIPVVPLYGDMHLTLAFVLRRCPHWNETMLKEWTTKQPQKLAGQ